MIEAGVSQLNEILTFIDTHPSFHARGQDNPQRTVMTVALDAGVTTGALNALPDHAFVQGPELEQYFFFCWDLPALASTTYANALREALPGASDTQIENMITGPVRRAAQASQTDWLGTLIGLLQD